MNLYIDRDLNWLESEKDESRIKVHGITYVRLDQQRLNRICASIDRQCTAEEYKRFVRMVDYLKERGESLK